MSTATPPLGSNPRSAKYTLWAALLVALIVALITTDLPLLAPSADPYRAEIIRQRFVLIPHAVLAFAGMIIGPFQFSTRFRQRHLALHRLMGKVYVICILIAAPMAVWLGFRSVPALNHGSYVTAIANTALGVGWFVCTLIAFLTARNRHIAVHRQWMVRSYLFTLNFIFTRVLDFWPAYAHLSDAYFADVLWGLTIAYILLPDIYFNWREITTRRA